MLVNATRTSSPLAEPVTVETMRLHMREDLVDSANDAYIQELITTARESLEDRLSLCLITTEWVSRFQTLEQPFMVLPLQPVQEVTAITYTDADGATQTLSAALYTVDKDNFPVRIRPSAGSFWPHGTEFTVAYTAGYNDTADAVPAALRQWIRMAVTDMYRHRGASGDKPFVPQQFAEHLLDPFYPYEV